MKNQVPDIKSAAPKRLSPDLDEFLHMLKSIEADPKPSPVTPFRG